MARIFSGEILRWWVQRLLRSRFHWSVLAVQLDELAKPVKPTCGDHPYEPSYTSQCLQRCATRVPVLRGTW